MLTPNSYYQLNATGHYIPQAGNYGYSPMPPTGPYYPPMQPTSNFYQSMVYDNLMLGGRMFNPSVRIGLPS